MASVLNKALLTSSQQGGGKAPVSFKGKALTEIDLRAEDLSTGVTKIDVSNNALTSLGPSGYGASLTWLNASKNQISDVTALKDMTSLKVLNLGENKLSGRFQAGRLKSLCALVLNGNQLDALGGVGNLRELNTVVLSNNKIATLAAVFPSAKVPKIMEKLSLGHNLLKSIEPGAFDAAEHLVELRLGHNKLKALPDLSKAQRLRILDLGGNPISDWEALQPLAATRVKNLNLKGCPVAADPDYESRILELIPRLDILDGQRIKDRPAPKPQKHKHESSGAGATAAAVPGAFTPRPPSGPPPASLQQAKTTKALREDRAEGRGAKERSAKAAAPAPKDGKAFFNVRDPKEMHLEVERLASALGRQKEREGKMARDRPAGPSGKGEAAGSQEKKEKKRAREEREPREEDAPVKRRPAAAAEEDEDDDAPEEITTKKSAVAAPKPGKPAKEAKPKKATKVKFSNSDDEDEAPAPAPAPASVVQEKKKKEKEKETKKEAKAPKESKKEKVEREREPTAPEPEPVEKKTKEEKKKNKRPSLVEEKPERPAKKPREAPVQPRADSDDEDGAFFKVDEGKRTGVVAVEDARDRDKGKKAAVSAGPGEKGRPAVVQALANLTKEVEEVGGWD